MMYRIHGNIYDFDNHVIKMIKGFRSSFYTVDGTGNRSHYMGLHQAKEACLSMRDGEPYEMHLTVNEIESLRFHGFDVERNGVAVKFGYTVGVYMAPHDRKINAIKSFRQISGYGLKEAKDAIDYMWNNRKPYELKMINDAMILEFEQNGFTVTGHVQDHFNDDLFEI